MISNPAVSRVGFHFLNPECSAELVLIVKLTSFN